MKIETTQVTKIKLSEVKALDPITIILEDFEPGKGKIIIECYGKSWSSYWGAMSGMSIADFVCSCDNDYMAKNLDGGIRSGETDEEGVPAHAKKHICKLRREREIDNLEARELYDEMSHMLDYRAQPNLMRRIYGDDWWYSLPDKPNPDYQYLCRIIDAVRIALKQHLKG